MEIIAKCMYCSYDFPLRGLLEGPVRSGTCPSCGNVLAPEYTALLIETVRGLDDVGTQLERKLARLRGGWVRVRIEPESLVGRLEEILREQHTTSPPLRRPDVIEKPASRFSHIRAARSNTDRRSSAEDGGRTGAPALRG
jgi:hypothetical protein